MLSQIFIVASLALSALAVPTYTPRPRPLPECSSRNVPCKCPAGTNFVNSTTYAVVGANAKDIYAIAGSYFRTDWFGYTPVRTTGRDNKKGSIRYLVGETDVGVYEFGEELTYIREKRDGSFIHKYRQNPYPVLFDPKFGNGSYSGYWDTLDVDALNDRQTNFIWNIYACFTNGTPELFAPFHESAINNITAILKTRNQIKGESVAPYSINEVQN